VKFVAKKKGMTTNFFSLLSFVAVPGSGIRGVGWVKIRIRDKHPGSATLSLSQIVVMKVWVMQRSVQGRDGARS
jgi:hypothetical protein